MNTSGKIWSDDPPVEPPIIPREGECATCRRYKGRFKCDGCGDDFGMYCGHCCRPVFVAFAGHVMPQRLCPACRLSGDNPSQNGIYDARYYNLDRLKECYSERKAT